MTAEPHPNHEQLIPVTTTVTSRRNYSRSGTGSGHVRLIVGKDSGVNLRSPVNPAAASAVYRASERERGPPMTTPLPHRAIAMLRAVAAGRAELTASSEPDLRVDGLPCCDQAMAHDLVHAGLVVADGSGAAWMPARLTPSGERALASAGPPPGGRAAA
ncbi:hypothetical protein KUTG_09837 [Kutzneria sp. 744]|nr:hypothetical protein KUTG_09837 [Kutzneria sp. 744]